MKYFLVTLVSGKWREPGLCWASNEILRMQRKGNKVIYLIWDKEESIGIIRSHRFHPPCPRPQIRHLSPFSRALDITSPPHLIWKLQLLPAAPFESRICQMHVSLLICCQGSSYKSITGKRMGLGPGCWTECCLHCPLTVWPWARHLGSLSISYQKRVKNDLTHFTVAITGMNELNM